MQGAIEARVRFYIKFLFVNIRSLLTLYWSFESMLFEEYARCRQGERSERERESERVYEARYSITEYTTFDFWSVHFLTLYWVSFDTSQGLFRLFAMVSYTGHCLTHTHNTLSRALSLSLSNLGFGVSGFGFSSGVYSRAPMRATLDPPSP
jgi:hypothetical protein